MSVLDSLRRKPLAAGVAVALVLSTPAAIANTVFVTNCHDGGVGSLRQAVTPAAANSGDTIDITGLPLVCAGMITLTTGEIVISQTNLTLHGPATGVAVKYHLGGSGHGRVFKHTGTGTLKLENVTVALGQAYALSGSAIGGCINSKGNIHLDHSDVVGCSAVTKDMFGFAGGGGVYATGDITVAYSTISGNSLDGKLGGASGGGIYGRGKIVIDHSTISGNDADGKGGGVYVSGFTGNSSLTIANSTISGNSAHIIGGGGVYVSNTPVTVQNSTIAFNTADQGKIGADYISPGLAILATNKDLTVTLQSSILSNNTYGTTENDFSTQVSGGHTITTNGANNLIRVASAALPTNGLIVGACPHLGALRNNGGPSRTHALLSHSAAIDTGNNNSKSPGSLQPSASDQRGLGFARVSAGSADIGAYEVQQADIVFNADFEDCP